MPCTPIGNGIVCHTPRSDSARLHVGKKYIWMEFHRYCGPFFATDSNMENEYVPVDENDPVWRPFEKWMDKRNA